jgi:hypothetical protein
MLFRGPFRAAGLSVSRSFRVAGRLWRHSGARVQHASPEVHPPCACDHGFQTRRRGAAKELCDGWYEPGFFAKPVRRLIIHVGKPLKSLFPPSCWRLDTTAMRPRLRHNRTTTHGVTAPHEQGPRDFKMRFRGPFILPALFLILPGAIPGDMDAFPVAAKKLPAAAPKFPARSAQGIC